MSHEMYYPDRQRCKTCRKYFGFEVIDGLFCSWNCAGRVNEDPRSFTDIEEAPRQCKSRASQTVNGHVMWRWKWKTQYKDTAAAKKNHSGQTYKCEFCRKYHRAS